jgi:lysozyme family protein
MANFIEAYNITMKNEGGYVNDTADVGGETYKGISRKYNPFWSGWVIVDEYKSKPGFPSTAYNDANLNSEVREFYKASYWDVNLLDEFPSQKISNEMFDTAVNMGVGRAGKFLQKALNLLNKNGAVYPDIAEDGSVGTNTLKALNSYLAYKDESFIYKIMNILQGMHYIEYMTQSPTQEKFAFGWMERIEFLKK